MWPSSLAPVAAATMAAVASQLLPAASLSVPEGFITAPMAGGAGRRSAEVTSSGELHFAPTLVRSESQPGPGQSVGAQQSFSGANRTHDSASGSLQTARAWFSELFTGDWLPDIFPSFGGESHNHEHHSKWMRGGPHVTHKNVIGPEVCARLRAMQGRNKEGLLQTYGNDFGDGKPISEEDQLQEPDFEGGILEVYKNDTDFPLLVAVSRKMVSLVREHFNTTQVYPEGTQLTKRRGHVNNTGMSTHADNCQFGDVGTSCRKTEQCCAWRSHTAMLYLSDDDVDGGEFYFAKGADAGDERDEPAANFGRPVCGKFVAFTSGGENLHGLKPLRHGLRYNLAMWLVEDPKYADPFDYGSV
jgi:hypothetical protein